MKHELQELVNRNVVTRISLGHTAYDENAIAIAKLAAYIIKKEGESKPAPMTFDEWMGAEGKDFLRTHGIDSALYRAWNKSREVHKGE